MKKYPQLQALGLSGQMIDIYLFLTGNKAQTISDIAKRVGIHRPMIYKLLPELTQKGLVTTTKLGKRILYTAESPINLKGLLSSTETKLEQIIPELLERYQKSSSHPIMTFYEGSTGIKHIYEVLLRAAKKGEVIYRYESPKDYIKNKRYYPKLYVELASAEGPLGRSQIQKFVITNENTANLRHPTLERYSKAVPAKYDPFEYNITQIIFGNKVAFIDYETETATLIENEVFAKFQRQIFKLLFEKL
jgi:predicted transcriptional regulator